MCTNESSTEQDTFHSFPEAILDRHMKKSVSFLFEGQLIVTVTALKSKSWEQKDRECGSDRKTGQACWVLGEFDKKSIGDVPVPAARAHPNERAKVVVKSPSRKCAASKNGIGRPHRLAGGERSFTRIPRGVSKSKMGLGTESKAGTGSEIENETGVEIECGIGIRIESLIGIEILKMKELFALGLVQSEL
ncbi:hypothetical protein EVAR_43013_1 [Eumeta japonica]|uniref:Uncharacterized protein n=1 Tax=Eumeta variegata TaxID=151549 RepID=A0A4C1XP11_EUMVA|nr:hypothetical protein EVAR_43013_1 [Eumeta japonica]